MATFLNEPYSTFSKRLTDWLNTAGGEVTDLTLDLYNRAQQYLCLYRAWDGLLTHWQSTLTSNVITLPTNFSGTVCSVYIDTNEDGKPDKFFYRDAGTENGYKAVNSFAKATGHSWTFTFFTTPSANPYVVYPVTLEDFEGTGTEYSFFPSDLLTTTAKKIHIEESDLVGKEYDAILNQQTALLRDYEQSHQYQNIEWKMRQIDDSGDEIGNEAYDLEGGAESSLQDDYDNDYDLG